MCLKIFFLWLSINCIIINFQIINIYKKSVFIMRGGTFLIHHNLIYSTKGQKFHWKNFRGFICENLGFRWKVPLSNKGVFDEALFEGKLWRFHGNTPLKSSSSNWEMNRILNDVIIFQTKKWIFHKYLYISWIWSVLVL